MAYVVLLFVAIHKTMHEIPISLLQTEQEIPILFSEMIAA